MVPMSNHNTSLRRDEHLARLGKQLSVVARLIVVPLVLIPIVRWWLPAGTLLMPATLMQNTDTAHLLLEQRLAGTFVDLLTTSVGVAVLLALARFGACFSTGRGLSPSAATLQRLLGRRLLWLAVAQSLYTPMVTLAVTLFDPPGHRILAITLNGGEVAMLVAAIAVFLFARVTEEAVRLADENAQIV